MQIINLVNNEKSDIKFTISKFPDGEVQVTLGEINRKDEVQIKCRITNAEELFIVKQVLDILDRHEVVYDVFISYLMGMRMDRVMDFNRPFTLKIVVDILNSSNARLFEVLEPHSERTCQLFGSRWREKIHSIIPKSTDVRSQLIVPDTGAAERYNRTFLFSFPADTIFCSKVRDVKTGKILSIKVDNPEILSGVPLLIIDDLCDGGGTFCGISSEIRKINPDAKISISVTHMVNPKGIENLSRTFDHVYFTNSYKDWNNLPENVSLIEVI